MCDVPLSCANWDASVELIKLVHHKNELDACEENKKDIDDPLKLKLMKEWDKFHEGLILYVRTCRGAHGIPLAYVVCLEATAMIEDYLAEYASEDEQYICCTKLKGPLYEGDNKVVWELLKRLLMNDNAWTFISKWDVKKDGPWARNKEDGRAAYLALIEQSVQVNREENKARQA